jgi:hypothetical protein
VIAAIDDFRMIGAKCFVTKWPKRGDVGL